MACIFVGDNCKVTATTPDTKPDDFWIRRRRHGLDMQLHSASRAFSQATQSTGALKLVTGIEFCRIVVVVSSSFSWSSLWLLSCPSFFPSQSPFLSLSDCGSDSYPKAKFEYLRSTNHAPCNCICNDCPVNFAIVYVPIGHGDSSSIVGVVHGGKDRNECSFCFASTFGGPHRRHLGERYGREGVQPCGVLVCERSMDVRAGGFDHLVLQVQGC